MTISNVGFILDHIKENNTNIRDCHDGVFSKAYMTLFEIGGDLFEEFRDISEDEKQKYFRDYIDDIQFSIEIGDYDSARGVIDYDLEPFLSLIKTPMPIRMMSRYNHQKEKMKCGINKAPR